MQVVDYEFFGLKLNVYESGKIEVKARSYTARNQHAEYTRNLPSKILTPVCNGKAGYYQIKFNNGGKSKAEYVHRIVWQAFNGTIPEGYEIDHEDNDKSNNALYNLNLKTRKQNMEKALSSMQRDSNGRFLKN